MLKLKVVDSTDQYFGLTRHIPSTTHACSIVYSISRPAYRHNSPKQHVRLYLRLASSVLNVSQQGSRCIRRHDSCGAIKVVPTP